jgi:hypothetical protein
MAEQIKVNRLLSFLCGSLMGVFMQLVSVVVFTRIVLNHKDTNAVGATGSSSILFPASTSLSSYNSMLEGDYSADYVEYGDTIGTIQHLSSSSTSSTAVIGESNFDHDHHDHHHHTCMDHMIQILIWFVYNLSLAVYLIVWFAMMTLAISKVGWRCISTWLSLRSNRRTCFLKTFFFINGFVQGSLMPWIFLEVYIGNPSFDVYWMPTTHLLAFFAVVHIYDWMKDTAPTSSPSSSGIIIHEYNHDGTDSKDHEDYDEHGNDDHYDDDDDDEDDDGTKFLV